MKTQEMIEEKVKEMMKQVLKCFYSETSPRDVEVSIREVLTEVYEAGKRDGVREIMPKSSKPFKKTCHIVAVGILSFLWGIPLGIGIQILISVIKW